MTQHQTSTTSTQTHPDPAASNQTTLDQHRKARLERVLPSGRAALIIPMDHGLSLGAIAGLEDPAKLLGQLAEARVDGTLMSAGMAKTLAGQCRSAGMSLTLTADDQYWGNRPGTPEHIGGILTVCRAQQAAEESYAAGLPLMLEPLWFGPALSPDEHDEVIVHAARIAWEYGADILKIPAVGPRALAKILRWGVPTVFLGGAKTDDRTQLMDRIRHGIEAGARGVVMGRNVWQSADMHGMIAQLQTVTGGQR